MIKRMKITELRPGMHLTTEGGNWKIEPRLYWHTVRLQSREQIQAIADAGYAEALVDLSASDPDCLTRELPLEAHPAAMGEQEPALLCRTRPLAEELRAAKQVYASGVAHAHKFMDAARQGIFDYRAAEPYVDGMLRSLERNPDALLALSRLRSSDQYTYTHCMNVAVLGTSFARYLGLPSNSIYHIAFGGLFHDLGKALIPIQLLNAPRKLSDLEFSILQQHPMLGFRELQKTPGIRSEVLQAALEHHEKFDGTGYPLGLSGKSISTAGSIVALADVYDALTSKRVYKQGMYPHKALGIMYQLRDSHWDQNLLNGFIRMLGIYPVGSLVRLDNGWEGVILQTNAEKPLQPVVAAMLNPEKQWAPQIINLAEQGKPAIVCGLAPKESSINPMAVLEKFSKKL